MLGFATKAELVPVEQDEAVMAAAKPLMEAQKRLEAIEAEEKRLLSFVTTDAHSASDDQIEEAHERLSIKKGSQSAWFLPEAQTVRDELRTRRATYQAAAQAARTRLEAAGIERLKLLLAELHEPVLVAQAKGREIEDLRQTVGQGGGDLGGHPVPCLLPGQILDFQLGIAKAQGFL